MPAEAGGQSTGVLKNARRLGVLLYSARRLWWFFFSTPVLTPPALSNLVARVKIMSCEPRLSLGPKNYSARGTNKIWRYLDI
jgi:hypothetical protein